MKSEWMSGVWLPSHRMRVVSAIWGSGVSVFPVTAPTVAPAPRPPDVSSISVATGAFLFKLHDERTSIEAATVLMARPGRQPPISSSLSSPGAGSSHRIGSEQRLSGHLLSQEDLHRVGCRPLRMSDLGHSRGRTAISLEQDPRDDALRLDDLLISIVSECEANRLEARGERQPLGVLGGDQQRDRRHLDRLLVLLLDTLARGEHLHVLQDHLAPLILLTLGLPGDDDVDVAVRRDEAADAAPAVDPERHAAHPVGGHETQHAEALQHQTPAQDRLMPFTPGRTVASTQ